MPRYLDVEVSLLGVRPKTWRRFLLSEEGTFHDLHEAIQISCGWEGHHLYEFSENDKRRTSLAGPDLPDNEAFPFEEKAPPAHTVRRGSFFKRKGQKCVYVYDFGDNWEHLVELKQFAQVEDGFSRKLLDGSRAFPLEDCGGIWGYYHCLEALGVIDSQDSDELELEQRREWMGDWDPEQFDLDAVRKEFDH